MTDSFWRKQCLKSPDSTKATLENMFGTGDHPELQGWLDSLSSLQHQADKLRMEKGQTSRLVGQARKDGNNPDKLIAKVKDITLALKEIEAELDGVLNQIEVASRKLDISSTKPDTQAGASMPGYLHIAVLDKILDVSEVIITDVVEAEAWQDYVKTHPGATLYHDLRWKDLLEEATGHEGHYFTARDRAGKVVGVLPTMHMQSRLFGNFMVSMPFVNYGGPLACNSGIAEQLMSAASKRAADMGCSHSEIRETAPRTSWASRTHKVTMIRTLPASDVEFELELRSKIRSQAKRALQAGATVSVGGAELLADFYAVFSRNMRDLGTPVQSRAFFNAMLSTFTSETFLVVVYIKQKPVACAFLLAHGRSLEVPWASALREYNQLSVNMMLYRHVLAAAIERGYSWFDFGRSSENAPTYRFKRQWGARPHTLHWHYWLKSNNELPGLNPDNPKFRLVINAWQRSPLWLTNRLGPHLVKNLP